MGPRILRLKRIGIGDAFGVLQLRSADEDVRRFLGGLGDVFEDRRVRGLAQPLYALVGPEQLLGSRAGAQQSVSGLLRPDSKQAQIDGLVEVDRLLLAV